MTTPRPGRDVGGNPAGNGSGKITREAVLAAALEIIDQDGAELCPCAAWRAPWTATR